MHFSTPLIIGLLSQSLSVNAQRYGDFKSPLQARNAYPSYSDSYSGVWARDADAEAEADYYDSIYARDESLHMIVARAVDDYLGGLERRGGNPGSIVEGVLGFKNRLQEVSAAQHRAAHDALPVRPLIHPAPHTGEHSSGSSGEHMHIPHMPVMPAMPKQPSIAEQAAGAAHWKPSIGDQAAAGFKHHARRSAEYDYMY